MPHLRDYPEDVDALNLIALAHFQMAKFPAARSAYLQMWSIAPTDIRAMYGMA